MRNILLQRKKGVSELISYTLLIIIAIAASVLVYNYLSLYVPKDKPVCPEDVSLVVSYANCKYGPDNSDLTIGLLNKGKFTIDAAFIRIGEKGKSTKKLVSGSQSEFYFLGGLSPNALVNNKNYSLSDSEGNRIITKSDNYTLEIQPAIFDDKLNKLAVCTNAIVTQEIECK